MREELLAPLRKLTAEEIALQNGGALCTELYTSDKHFVIDYKKMLESGKTVAIRPHTRFVDFPRHTHNFVEMMYVCSGTITHQMEDQTTVTLQAGELLFLNQYASHAISRAEEEDIAVNFVMLPQFFDQALPMLSEGNPLKRFLMGCLQNLQGNVSYLHFRVRDSLPIQNLMENLIWSLTTQPQSRYRINQTTMTLLLLQLSDCMELAQTDYHAAYPALVNCALREIEENYATVTLNALAQRYSVSDSYFSQMIRRCTGRTFQEILLEQRLAKAAFLLLHTDLTVQGIIHAVGYENTAYFYRVFYQKYHVRPSDYRKM